MPLAAERGRKTTDTASNSKLSTMIRPVICFALLTANIAQANRGPFRHLSSWHSSTTNRDQFGNKKSNTNSNLPGWTTVGSRRRSRTALVLFPRGGDDGVVAPESPTAAADVVASAENASLDDRVQAAMRRLGLQDDSIPDDAADESQEASGESTMNCEDGVCTLEPTPVAEEKVMEDVKEHEIEVANANEIEDAVEDEIEVVATETEIEVASENKMEDENEIAEIDDQDIYSVAERISKDMSVPNDLAMAAISASLSGTGDERRIEETAARAIVQAELDAIANVPEDCDEVKQLVSEGFDMFHSRRSLAFSGMSIETARAILVADQEDEAAEIKEMEEAKAAEAKMQEEEKAKLTTKAVTVNTNFDPLASMASATPPKPVQQQPKKPEGMPKKANKEDVIFEGTTEDLQKLVIESPVPVLLDVYADWCGPCKQLTPALEQICLNAGGMLRLVKINTDQQRQVSGALEVKSLPSVYGIRDGKIVNMFMGLPRNEDFIRNFLMGLMVPGQKFQPPVTAEEEKTYDELSAKLLKVAAGASFSFSSREMLQNKIAKELDELVNDLGGETGMAIADDTARILRSLMSNVIVNPFDQKFRKIKLDNKVIASKIAQYAPCMSILKSIGFVPEGDSVLVVGKGKKAVNIAPFVVGRDCIDKWIDRNRYHIAKAARLRKDEILRVRLAAEAEEAAKNRVDESEDEEEEDEEVDPNLCTLKVRLDGKKKVYDIEMDANDTLVTLLEKLPFPVEDGETVQFTCVAKRLIVKSNDGESMKKTLSQLKLMPAASVVVKIGDGKAAESASGSLKERASSKKKKTGSHSMHSIGLYAKDDGNKAEMFDGGGGVMWEHDVTDDEDENVDENNGENEGEAEKDETGAEDDNASGNDKVDE